MVVAPLTPSREPSLLRVLAFDAYGTLFDVHSVVETCNRLFPRQGNALSRLWRTKQLEYTWLRSLISCYTDFWRVTEDALIYACQALGLSCDETTRQILMEAYLHLQTFPEVPEVLQNLSARYSLVILSNGSPHMLQAVAKNAGLAPFFSHILSADSVRVYKPDPRVYRLVPETLKVKPEAVGFVSANAWDVVGAKAAGLRTFWINRTSSPPEVLGFNPDVTVPSLTELVQVLG